MREPDGGDPSATRTDLDLTSCHAGKGDGVDWTLRLLIYFCARGIRDVTAIERKAGWIYQSAYLPNPARVVGSYNRFARHVLGCAGDARQKKRK